MLGCFSRLLAPFSETSLNAHVLRPFTLAWQVFRTEQEAFFYSLSVYRKFCVHEAFESLSGLARTPEKLKTREDTKLDYT